MRAFKLGSRQRDTILSYRFIRDRLNNYKKISEFVVDEQRLQSQLILVHVNYQRLTHLIHGQTTIYTKGLPHDIVGDIRG